MPSGFSALDTSFPDLNGKGTEESIQIVTDYLYQLLEQLRYMLHNLGTRNFNQTELEAFASSISEPIHIALQEEVERAEGAEATLQTNINIEANRITAEVSRAEGAESALGTRITQTADAITAEVTRATAAEGTLSSRITQNADAISAEVTRASGAEGALGSRITQNADAITAEVTRATAAEGTLGSRITQTASDITAEVSRATGAESAIQQSADAIKAQVTDGQGNYTVLNLKSDGLHIGSAAGTTTINGGSITANTIGAQQIAAGSITATEIAGRTITAAEIATGTITANEIAANTITAAEIAANTIGANQIVVGTIPTDTSDLTNGAGYQTSANVTTIIGNTVTTGYVNALGITAKYLKAGDLDIVSAGGYLRGYIDLAANAFWTNIAAFNLNLHSYGALTLTSYEEKADIALDYYIKLQAERGLVLGGAMYGSDAPATYFANRGITPKTGQLYFKI